MEPTLKVVSVHLDIYFPPLHFAALLHFVLHFAALLHLVLLHFALDDSTLYVIPNLPLYVFFYENVHFYCLLPVQYNSKHSWMCTATH